MPTKPPSSADSGQSLSPGAHPSAQRSSIIAFQSPPFPSELAHGTWRCQAAPPGTQWAERRENPTARTRVVLPLKGEDLFMKSASVSSKENENRNPTGRGDRIGGDRFHRRQVCVFHTIFRLGDNSTFTMDSEFLQQVNTPLPPVTTKFTATLWCSAYRKTGCPLMRTSPSSELVEPGP